MKAADTLSSEHTVSDSLLSSLIPLNDVPRRLPRRNGKRLHISTVYRWTTSHGCKGVCLEHWKVGRNIYTTESALMKFFSELAAADSAKSDRQHAPINRKRHPRRTSDASRQQAIQEANTILVKAGIIPANPRGVIQI